MNLNELFELQYCVNLDEREDRWEQAKKEFDKINVYPQRFSAIKKENPALGCFLSHLEILKEAERQNKNVLIFEDDIEFINYDEELINAISQEIGNYHWWDMLYLGGNILKPFYQASNYLGKLTHCQSTHAYGVNRYFLTRLINWLERNIYILDVIYADTVVPHNNCFITIPMLAIQRTDYSDIERREMSYDIPIARYNKFLVKRQNNEKT